MQFLHFSKGFISQAGIALQKLKPKIREIDFLKVWFTLLNNVVFKHNDYSAHWAFLSKKLAPKMSRYLNISNSKIIELYNFVSIRAFQKHFKV